MNENQFWQLVQASDPLASPESVAQELKQRLEKLDNAELATFDKFFQQRMRLAYTWELWGAAFVIAGCDSEYAFAEFRSWLISRGQSIFESVLKQPDALADFNIITQVDELPYPYLDEYDLIAGLIFESRNGDELPFVPSGQSEPKGKRFNDKPKFLKTQYPKLYAKFYP